MAKKRKQISARKRKQINYLISLKARSRNLSNKAQKIEDKTERNELINKATKINTELKEYYEKTGLKQHSKYRRKSIPKKYKHEQAIGKVWEKDLAENFIFKNKKIKFNSVNGLIIGEDDSKILDIMNKMSKEMSSTDLYQIKWDDNYDIIMRIVGDSDFDDDDLDYE